MLNLNFFQSHFGKMASTSYNAVQVLDLLDADSSDSGSSGEEGDDIYGYRRPCIRVGGPDPVNSDTENGSQEDGQGKLVFLLKNSKLLLWKGLIYSYIEIE